MPAKAIRYVKLSRGFMTGPQWVQFRLRTGPAGVGVVLAVMEQLLDNEDVTVEFLEEIKDALCLGDPNTKFADIMRAAFATGILIKDDGGIIRHHEIERCKANQDTYNADKAKAMAESRARKSQDQKTDPSSGSGSSHDRMIHNTSHKQFHDVTGNKKRVTGNNGGGPAKALEAKALEATATSTATAQTGRVTGNTMEQKPEPEPEITKQIRTLVSRFKELGGTLSEWPAEKKNSLIELKKAILREGYDVVSGHIEDTKKGVSLEATISQEEAA